MIADCQLPISDWRLAAVTSLHYVETQRKVRSFKNTGFGTIRVLDHRHFSAEQYEAIKMRDGEIQNTEDRTV